MPLQHCSIQISRASARVPNRKDARPGAAHQPPPHRSCAGRGRAGGGLLPENVDVLVQLADFAGVPLRLGLAGGFGLVTRLPGVLLACELIWRMAWAAQS